METNDGAWLVVIPFISILQDANTHWQMHTNTNLSLSCHSHKLFLENFPTALSASAFPACLPKATVNPLSSSVTMPANQSPLCWQPTYQLITTLCNKMLKMLFVDMDAVLIAVVIYGTIAACLHKHFAVMWHRLAGELHPHQNEKKKVWDYESSIL